VGSASLPNPTQFEAFFPRRDTKKASYWQRFVKRKSYDKVEFALAAAPLMTRSAMAERFDWEAQMYAIVNRIKVWNA
jgi:hypothetical protein